MSEKGPLSNIHTCQTEMGLIVYFVKNRMGPKVQSGKTIWDQKSTHVKNGMGSIVHGING